MAGIKSELKTLLKENGITKNKSGVTLSSLRTSELLTMAETAGLLK